MRLNYINFHVLRLMVLNEFVVFSYQQQSATESVKGIYNKAAVATDNGVCSDIGKDILLQGGNAVDAVIAASICIGATQAHNSGLGGGHILTVYTKLNPIEGWLAVAVPGEVHGFWTAYKQLGGKLPWKNLWTPTIDMCRNGMRVTAPLAKALNQLKDLLPTKSDFEIFKNPQTGEYAKENDTVKRLILADTMEKIANAPDPVQLFYNGPLAKTMVSEIQANGGIIEENDFKDYSTRFGPTDRPPIMTRIKNGLQVCAPPPPSSGSLVASVLNIVDGYNFTDKDLSDISTESLAYHRIIEAMKYTYGVRYDLGDMDYIPSAAYLARTVNYNSYGAFTRERIANQSFKSPTYYGTSTFKWDSGTAHISVVDAEGNAAALTSTINTYFGARVISHATGIIYNNEMDDFSLSFSKNFFNITPSPANRLLPGKRPQSSMSPIIVFNESTGDVELTVGAAGGSGIISAVAQVAIRVLYFLQNIKAAIDSPRLHNQLEPFDTTYETIFSQNTVNVLSNKFGQKMSPNASAFSTAVIGIHRISNGSLEANSDFRKPGGYSAGF